MATRTDNIYTQSDSAGCIRYLKKRLTLYRMEQAFLAAIGAALAATIALPGSIHISVQILLAVLIFITLFHLALRRNYIFQAPSSVLYDQCDPGKYADILLFLLQHAGGQRKLLLTTNLCSAYYAMGEFGKAAELLSSLKKDSQQLPALQNFYYDMAMRLDAENEDYKNFGEYKAALEKLYDRCKDTDRDAALRALATLDVMSYYALAKSRDWGGMQAKLEQWLAACSCDYQSVYTQYLLGALLCKKGDRKGAQKYLEFAAEKGNTMYQAAAARKLLAGK